MQGEGGWVSEGGQEVGVRWMLGWGGEEVWGGGACQGAKWSAASGFKDQGLAGRG